MSKKRSNKNSIVWKTMEKLAQVVPPEANPATDPDPATPEPPANTGIMLAQRLTSALVIPNVSDYRQRSKAIYSELSAIASEMKKGDWLQFPDGTTFTMTFKPTQVQGSSGVNIKVAKDSYDWSWHESPNRTAPCKKCGKNKPIYQDNKCKECKTREVDEGEAASQPPAG